MAKPLSWAAADRSRLQRLSAHEAGLRGPRRHPLAHDRPTQRSEALHEEKRGGASALQRQKIRKQAAIEEIDPQHAARRIGAAHAIVALGQLPDVLALAMAGDHELADGRGVTQPEVEALRADWRNDVGGFADEYNPPRAKPSGGCGRPWEKAAGGPHPPPPPCRTRAGA